MGDAVDTICYMKCVPDIYYGFSARSILRQVFLGAIFDRVSETF